MESTNNKNFLKTIYKPADDIGLTFSILLMGQWGTGKTRLLGTAPLPLLIYMFDPKGAIVLHKVYPDLIKEGMIQYIPYWNEEASNPTEYARWEKDWEKHIKTGYLNQFGTVAIDSFTSWMDCAGNNWLYLRNQTRKGGAVESLTIGDYPGLYNLTRNMIKRTSGCNCNFVLTAHLEAEQLENLSVVRYVLSTYKGLKAIVPPLFSEKWVILKRPLATGAEYKILTNDEGLYMASTQIGADIFNRREEPNIRELLKKAGVSAEDKPKFWL